MCSEGFCGWIIDTGVPAVDAGFESDAGLESDAGFESDAGLTSDAALELDGGWAFDARPNEPDAAARDAGATDSGALDAGSPADASATDAAPTDSGGRPDGAHLDSGIPGADAGHQPDAATPDTGLHPDAATPDAGLRADAGGSLFIYDLSGFVLSNSEAAQQRFEIPPGTQLRAGEVLLLVRNADRTAFEVDLGHPLASNVRYLSTGASAQGAPIINGGERWRLNASDGRVVDGPTIAGAAGRAYRRTAAAAGQVDSWSEAADNARSPGSSAVLGPGLWISGWADASGSGRFIFEYVELSAQ